MPTLSLLVSENNDILGTLRQGGNGGQGAPATMGFQAGPGQRVVEVNVDDATAQLDPEALHAKIKADHIHEHGPRQMSAVFQLGPPVLTEPSCAQ
jgi:hypothetical protein